MKQVCAVRWIIYLQCDYQISSYFVSHLFDMLLFFPPLFVFSPQSGSHTCLVHRGEDWAVGCRILALLWLALLMRG